MTDGPDSIGQYPLVGEDTAGALDDVFIYGPPGTGKTTQLKRRLHEAFRKADREVADYTVVTYRRSQAQETLLELRDENWLTYEDVQRPSRGRTRYVGTLHAVCKRLIADQFSASRYSSLFGDAQPGVADESHRAEWAQQSDIRYDPYSSSETTGERLFDVWSWSRKNWPMHTETDARRFDDLSESDQRRVMMRAPKYDALGKIAPAELYQAYRDWLYAHGLMDFSDMLETVLGERLVPPTDGLVVDEAHDLSPVMLSVIIMWASDLDHILIAGDRDQVINRFDGARRAIYDQIPDHLDLSEVLLETSYRFPENIWIAARSMLANVHDTPPVTPAGSADHRGRIDVRESPRFDSNWVGETWTDDGTPAPSEENSPANLYDRFVTAGPYEDCLAMARTQTQLKGVQYALDRAGVAYTTQSSIRGWLTPLADTDDATRHSIYNLVTRLAQVDVDTVTEGEVIQQSTGTPASDVMLWSDEVEAFAEYVPLTHTTSSTRDEVQKYVDLADPTVEAAKLPLTRQGWTAVTDSRSMGLSTLNAWYANQAEYRSVRNAFDRRDGVLKTHDVQSMKLRTIHAAKGSEADVALVYDGLTNKIANAVMNDEASRKNEYRTWYVAFSRPREHLCILRGAWSMNTTSLIPEDFAARIVSQANREFDTVDTAP